MWRGEQCPQLEVGLATFFAEHRKSVRKSNVEVSRTPNLKFWRLLGVEENKIEHVRCVKYRSAPTELWGDTLMNTVPKRGAVASASPET